MRRRRVLRRRVRASSRSRRPARPTSPPTTAPESLETVRAGPDGVTRMTDDVVASIVVAVIGSRHEVDEPLVRPTEQER